MSFRKLDSAPQMEKQGIFKNHARYYDLRLP